MTEENEFDIKMNELLDKYSAEFMDWQEKNYKDRASMEDIIKRVIQAFVFKRSFETLFTETMIMLPPPIQDDLQGVLDSIKSSVIVVEQTGKKKND